VTEQSKGTNWRAWMIGALAVLVLIICLQNSQTVDFDILFINTRAPLIAILLIAVGVGAIIGYIAPLLRRHRREQRSAEGG
jgi:uncharacterized integral membrane protein